MNTWQIVLTCWLCYGIGVGTGYYLKSMFDKDDSTTELLEDLTAELLKEEGKNENNS